MRPNPPARRLTCGRANPLWRGGDAICKIVDSRTHSRFVLRILSSRRLSALSRQTPRFSISLIPADIPGSFCEFDCTRRLSAFRPVPSIFYLIDFSGHSRFVLRISISSSQRPRQRQSRESWESLVPGHIPGSFRPLRFFARERRPSLELAGPEHLPKDIADDRSVRPPPWI